MIPNPSFEYDGPDGIQGWEVVGARPRDILWTGEAHSGDRCIALHPTGSRLECRSAHLPARPGTMYGVEWWMTIEGNRPWHWTYWTNFTGVELAYLDADGKEMGIERRRLRCLRTDGWRRAWQVFDSPEGTDSVRLGFVLDSPDHIEMNMRIDDVNIKEVGGRIPEGRGRIAVRAYDGGAGPTFARFSVKDDNGQSLFPDFSYPFKSGLFYHLNDPALNFLDVPKGTYGVRATKGPAFEASEKAVEVKEGKQARVRLDLKPAFRDGLRGWLGGDHHVHLFFHKHSVHPQITVDDVMKIAKGEGLNFVSFCGEWTEFLDNMGNHAMAKDSSFIGQVGLESVNDFYGHLCTMGWTEVPPQGIPMRCVPWPMNTDTIESLEKMGGAWINAHPFDRIIPGKVVENMGDPERLCNARELPIILALGHRTCFDILCHATPGGAELKTSQYYRLLNMGFRIGITASTDFYVDQARGTPGHNRTYVRSTALDFAKVAEAYRLGRTYATNGPLVDLEVAGVKVGDQLDLPEGRHQLKGRIKAYSRMGLDRATIIVNGEPVKTLRSKGNRIDAGFQVEVTKSSWIAAHVEGPVNDDVEPWDLTPDQRNLQSQFAHTSPVYVEVGGRAIQPTVADVDFLLAWIDAARRAFHLLERMWDGHPEEVYLKSSFSAEERQEITEAFEDRVSRAVASLRALRQQDG